MDKWFDHPWVIKGISLLLSVLLFLVVNSDGTSNTTSGIPGITTGTRVLEEVPLKIYYDEDNQVITRAPEAVQVTLTGPQNLITILLLERTTYELYVDVRGKAPGTYYEQVRHKGFPKELSVSIFPSTVSITIQEKQTASFPVEVELLNDDKISEGYSIGTPTVTPANVDITAASGVIEMIGRVVAQVDVGNINKTVNEFVEVKVYDKNGKELDIGTNPAVVEVNVPITSPTKEVPLRIERKGELPTGVAIESLTTDPASVTVYGPSEVLEKITHIDLPAIDLSSITKSTTIEVEVPIPEGVERVAPETVLLEVKVTVEEMKQLTDFPIQVVGLSDEFELEFIEPQGGVIDFEIMGSPTVLERIDENDLQLYIDLDGYMEGEHEVPIHFNGSLNIRINDKDRFIAVVRVVKKETENGSEEQNDAETNVTNE